MGCCLCGDYCRCMVRRPLQQVCSHLLSIRAILIYEPKHSRGLHSALFAFIGAMGFLASAVLPADAYLVRASI